MKKLTIIFIVLIALFCSCSSSKFLNRKYTSGRFIEKTKTLKHNTIFVDSTQEFASKNDKIFFQRSLAKPSFQIEQEIIKTKVHSITIRKDSVFIRIKKGKDQKIVKKDSLNLRVITIMNEKGEIISRKNVILPNMKPAIDNNVELKEINRLGKIALICSIIPILGFIISLKFRKKFNVYRVNHLNEKLKKYSVKGTTAFTTSIIMTFGPLIFFIVIMLLFLLALALSA